ncbi:MAG TPA: hypothetical protein VGU43_04625 [Thermoplasmata archaeon]|nr:hypothetical protein [Thermoplasmata archaeon]
MTDPWDNELAEYEAARVAFEAKHKQEGAVFSRATAVAKADAATASTRIEAEYSNKVREAKSELAATARRVKAQLADFRLTRDALLRAESRKLDGLLAPARQARSMALTDLRKAKDEAWARYKAKRWPES